jgi:hypothetical protein
MDEPDMRIARTAYDAIAAAYADQFRDTLDDRPTECGLIAAFAESVRRGPDGPVADAAEHATGAIVFIVPDAVFAADL